MTPSSEMNSLTTSLPIPSPLCRAWIFAPTLGDIGVVALSSLQLDTRDTGWMLPGMPRRMGLRPAEPPVATRWAALIAVGAGLLGLLAFPRFGIWPLAFASVASLSVVVHGRRARQAAWLGLIYGAACF